MTFARHIQESREQRIEARQAVREPPSVKPLTAGCYAGEVHPVAPQPKDEPYRDPALLEMARDRPCLMLVPGICSHRTDTVVAAHSNLNLHGKGKSLKAHDVYTVWSCGACHSWLDQGSAPKAQKEATFMAAHARQVMAWREVAASDSEPSKARRAAIRAMLHLNAHPVYVDLDAMREIGAL